MKKCIVITTMLLVAAGLTEKMYAINRANTVPISRANTVPIRKAPANSIGRANNNPIARANALPDKEFQFISFPALNQQQLTGLHNSPDKRVLRAAQNIQKALRNGIIGLQANVDLIASQDKVTQLRVITIARLVAHDNADIAQTAALIANLPTAEQQSEYLKKLQSLISYNHRHHIQMPAIIKLRQELLGMLMDMQQGLDISKKKPMHVSGTSHH